MPTKNLSPTERLALQTGSVLQVFISNVSGKSIQVSLKPPSKNGDGSRIQPGTMRDASFPSKSSNFKNRKTSSSPTLVSQKSTVPPTGTMLNQLKTGMKLEGVVTSNTQYAVFVDTNVFRTSKGGTFTSVNGKLGCIS